MSTPAQPRHSRAEIRDFARWLRREGWTYESVDGNGHTIWSHPKSPTTYSLPETPRHFNIQRARRDVMRMVGQEPTGKRKPKSRAVPAAAPRRPAPVAMTYAMRCLHCGHVHDAANVTVVQRYTDCSVWRCPGCDVLIDDRPRGWGGSAERFKPPVEPTRRRTPRRLPWEDQPDNYDYGLDRLM